MLVETPQQLVSVNIYVDDSNISIGGRCHPEGNSDWDYDINLLSDIITSDLLYAGIDPFYRTFSFYGADLHRNHHLNLLRACRYPIVAAFDSHRNGRGKEKAADTRLTAHMTERIMNAHFFGEPAYFVVLSGDGDMVPAVEMAVKYGFPVCVWSWEESLSKKLAELAADLKNNGLVEIRLLEQHLDDITLNWVEPRVADEEDDGIRFTTELSDAEGEPESRH
ncbi:hypothetical protein FIE12Z_3395 [Fusarium flagelliforme]|uniref:NYN domain-containing protein n=1 Tax=Fusarium flagelliforme TaxID=2675880 RepID=A0A395MXD0_9HYPO|nr:hypothetical protein FIE12Z_3395 [Fusarium flagelliforme]